MSNKRAEVRTAVKDFLEGTLTGYKIISSRSKGLSQSEQLPTITVVTPNEVATPHSMNLQRYNRKIELRLEIRIEATQSTDDALDVALSEVENVVLANQSMGGAVLGSVLVGTETDVGYEGNTEIGLGVLIYEATYVS